MRIILIEVCIKNDALSDSELLEKARDDIKIGNVGFLIRNADSYYDHMNALVGDGDAISTSTID